MLDNLKKFKNFFRSESGVSLIAMIIAIIIMIAIASVLITKVGDFTATTTLNNMYRDVRLLNDSVNAYYSKYGTLPIKGSAIEPGIEEKNPNDNENYYYIDITLLENITLSGIDANYIINEQSHSIYNISGVELNGKTYYTLPETASQVFIISSKELKAKFVLSPDYLTSGNVEVTITNLKEYTKQYSFDQANWTEYTEIPIIVRENNTRIYVRIIDKEEFVDVGSVLVKNIER